MLERLVEARGAAVARIFACLPSGHRKIPIEAGDVLKKKLNPAARSTQPKMGMRKCSGK